MIHTMYMFISSIVKWKMSYYVIHVTNPQDQGYQDEICQDEVSLKGLLIDLREKMSANVPKDVRRFYQCDYTEMTEKK